MNSWWDLGEGYGYRGDELALYQIECPFCFEKGNFSLEHRSEKKKPNSRKILNFDTYKCGNCAGFVMVLWSNSASYGSSNLYDFRVLPYPKKVSKAPEHWPEIVQRYWVQAHRSVSDENWDAGVSMIRSALQGALREQKAKKGRLVDEIKDLTDKGVLPHIMSEWATEVRLLGNSSVHPDPENPEDIDPKDVNDLLNFLDTLLTYLYDLPKEISEFRERRKEAK